MPRTIWGKEKVTWMTQARFSMKTLCVFPLWFWALSGWGLLFVDAGSKKWTRRKKSECEKIKKMRWKNKTRCYKQKRIFCVWFFWRLRVGINVLLGKKERCGVEKNSCGSCSITFIDVMLEKRFVSWNRFILVFRKRYQIYKANPWKQFVLVSFEYWTWTWFLLNSEYVWVSVSERDISLHSLLSSDCVIPFFC